MGDYTCKHSSQHYARNKTKLCEGFCGKQGIFADLDERDNILQDGVRGHLGVCNHMFEHGILIIPSF